MRAEKSFFLFSQADIDKIDALISALALAVGEILEGCPVRDRREASRHAQAEYDREIGAVIYRDHP